MKVNKYHRFEVLVEHMNGEIKAIKEYVQVIPEIREDIRALKDDVSELKTDMKIVKSVVKVHSADIAELKTRLA